MADLPDDIVGIIQFGQHILRNTDSIRHVTAVLVNHLNELGDNRGSAVQDDRESGQTLGDLLKDVEAQLRFLDVYKRQLLT